RQGARPLQDDPGRAEGPVQAPGQDPQGDQGHRHGQERGQVGERRGVSPPVRPTGRLTPAAREETGRLTPAARRLNRSWYHPFDPSQKGGTAVRRWTHWFPATALALFLSGSGPAPADPG